MKSLKEIISDKGADYEFEEIDPEHLIGLVNNEPRVIHAILDRTAVVYPFNDATDRAVRKLELVMVWPGDIKWRQRPVIFTLGHGLQRWDSSKKRKEKSGS